MQPYTRGELAVACEAAKNLFEVKLILEKFCRKEDFYFEKVTNFDNIIRISVYLNLFMMSLLLREKNIAMCLA